MIDFPVPVGHRDLETTFLSQARFVDVKGGAVPGEEGGCCMG